MSNAVSNRGILASRRGGDVLIADEPVRVVLSWPTVPTADGEEVRVSWSASVTCVDSAADRALLAERYFGDSSAPLAVSRVATELSTAIASIVRAVAVKVTTDEALHASDDGVLSKAIEAAARAEAFAGGLAVLPPFRLVVESPSRERERRLAESRERLAAIAENDGARAKSLAEATRALVESAGDPRRAARAMASLRLADPLDVLRATAIVDPAWSAAAPSLFIAASTRLMRVDPTRPNITAADALSLGDALGPIRSVSRASIDGEAVLLIGARDGVHVLTQSGPIRVTHTFRHVAGSDFGFNSACFLPADRLLVATHSRAGIVVWRFDDPSAEGRSLAVEGARSVVALDEHTALLVVNGRLVSFSGDGELTPIAGNVREMSVISGNAMQLIRESAAGDTRHAAVVGVEDVIEVAGVPRTVRPLTRGGLEMIDAARLTTLMIGPSTIAARAVAMRPGFVAAVSVDRTRVSLIDLAQPEAVASELHISATLGSRVADARFA